MAAASGLGVTIDERRQDILFGEDQARYLVACPFDSAEALMTRAYSAGVPLTHVGRFGGDKVRLGRSKAPLADLVRLHRSAFAAALG